MACQVDQYGKYSTTPVFSDGIMRKESEAGLIVQGRMFGGGVVKPADISAEEFAKYQLNCGNVFFNRTNSIERVGKTGLFDRKAASALLSALYAWGPNAMQVLSLFLALLMIFKAFQQKAKGTAVKSINQASINTTVMYDIKALVLSLAEQKRFVPRVETLAGASPTRLRRNRP